MYSGCVTRGWPILEHKQPLDGDQFGNSSVPSYMSTHDLTMKNEYECLGDLELNKPVQRQPRWR